MRWRLKLIIILKSIAWTLFHCTILAIIASGFMVSPLEMIIGGVIMLVFVLVYHDVRDRELEKDCAKNKV